MKGPPWGVGRASRPSVPARSVARSAPIATPSSSTRPGRERPSYAAGIFQGDVLTDPVAWPADAFRTEGIDARLRPVFGLPLDQRPFSRRKASDTILAC